MSSARQKSEQVRLSIKDHTFNPRRAVKFLVPGEDAIQFISQQRESHYQGVCVGLRIILYVHYTILRSMYCFHRVCISRKSGGNIDHIQERLLYSDEHQSCQLRMSINEKTLSLRSLQNYRFWGRFRVIKRSSNVYTDSSQEIFKVAKYDKEFFVSQKARAIELT